MAQKAFSKLGYTVNARAGNPVPETVTLTAIGNAPTDKRGAKSRLDEQESDCRRCWWDELARDDEVFCPSKASAVNPADVCKLGMSTALDRFIQQAVLQVLLARSDQSFPEHSYGFCPRRSAHVARWGIAVEGLDTDDPIVFARGRYTRLAAELVTLVHFSCANPSHFGSASGSCWENRRLARIIHGLGTSAQSAPHQSDA